MAQKKVEINRKYISYRVSRGRAYWLFRLAMEGRVVNMHYKTFYVRHYGSKGKALNAAIQYRDDYLTGIGEMRRLSRFDQPRHSHIGNISGIVGVRAGIQNKKYGSYRFWQSYGIVEGKQWKRNFAVNAHGEKSAFKLACKARYEHSGELAISVPISQLPCTPGVPWKRYKAA